MIFAEHAEHGYLAAPIAKHIIETYYARKEGRPLPILPPLPVAPGAIRSRRARRPLPPRRGRPGGARRCRAPRPGRWPGLPRRRQVVA